MKRRGDAAVLEYTARFDGVDARERWPSSSCRANRSRARATRCRARSARRWSRPPRASAAYHEQQLAQSWQYTEADGTVLGQKVTPLDRVGLYVPGGKAAYPSSVLMNAMPAKVAGVAELIMVVPTPRGEKNQLVLAAAAIAGVDRVFTIGGAQAVAALAYGTETIAAGGQDRRPGQRLCRRGQAARVRRGRHRHGRRAVGDPGDLRRPADPDWIAMDLFSQAEHDELAQAILLCPDAAFIEAVAASIDQAAAADAAARSDCRLARQPRRADPGAQTWTRPAPSPTASRRSTSNWPWPSRTSSSAGSAMPAPSSWARYSSEAIGDYCAGPNHVLPTSRSARFSSPLGVYDFQKRSSLIQVSRAGAQTLGRIAATLAEGEGLQAHARSAEYRLRRS